MQQQQSNRESIATDQTSHTLYIFPLHLNGILAWQQVAPNYGHLLVFGLSMGLTEVNSFRMCSLKNKQQPRL